jgi:hypothetical protein
LAKQNGTSSPGPYKALTFIFGAAIGLYLLFSVLGLRLTTDESAGSAPDFPHGGPAEFLYLDSSRVGAYLGQVDGGSFDSEKVTRKLTDTLSGKLTLAGAAEAGGSREQESLVEREVKPTEASSFFALYAALGDADLVTPIRLRFFENDVRDLKDGEFVSFKTTALRSPIYVNPYLASRRVATLAAIFPGGKKELEERSTAKRRAAERFVARLGANPRVVFSLHPEGGQAESSFVYLLPMNAERLTEERSLLKFGGGQFNVVGKVIRIFPELKHDHVPAYVDSPTLEIWERPLRRAPGELLCRTDPRCAKRVREARLRGKARRAEIRASRVRALSALREQTAIGRRGAVILPIGIYK